MIVRVRVAADRDDNLDHVPRLALPFDAAKGSPSQPSLMPLWPLGRPRLQKQAAWKHQWVGMGDQFSLAGVAGQADHLAREGVYRRREDVALSTLSISRYLRTQCI